MANELPTSKERLPSEFDSWQRPALQLFATVHANLASRQAANIERLQQRLRMRMESCSCNQGSPVCDDCKGDQKVLARGNGI